ncbi:IMPACT family protein [Algoriphagus vanfongensis]|uniref:IMPACT family protein n=1 Tax=Algoriphagus vanfongensis TaxID=426371 RepID=UPI00041FE70F|nr:YigZ family protein [Algoriphagus vanfongensis]
MEEPLPSDSYLTLAKDSSGLYKDRNSKFFYFAFPVSNEEEVKERLAELKKKYYDARHHCYGFVIGRDGDFFRASDDGEPNHTAGDPILGQIRSHQLTNTLVVVVRYFGGTKLGVGGLIQAYKSSASLAIEANEIIVEQVKEKVTIHFPYPVMNDVMKLVKNHDLQIIAQEMTLDCKMTLEYREILKEELLGQLDEIQDLKFI